MASSKYLFLEDYLWPDCIEKYEEILKDQEKMEELLLAIISWLQKDGENERRAPQVFKDIMVDYFIANWQERIANDFEKAYLNIFD